MTVASFFRKYSVGCILNYVRLVITREISCRYIQCNILQLCTEVSQVTTTTYDSGHGTLLANICETVLGKMDVSQALVSLIDDNIEYNHFEVFLVTAKQHGNCIIESKVGFIFHKANSHLFVS
jgi:hypothetical protein